MIAHKQAASRAAQQGSRSCQTPQQQLRQARRAVVLRVSNEGAGPTTTMTGSQIPRTTQDASGYVEFDTAGQSNMYPVITRAYEAGSNQDTLETGSSNFVVGIGAGVIAVAVLALGLTALSQQGGGAGVDGLDQFKSLSEYAAAFSAEL